MRADGRTDITKLKVVFRNFVNAPKNGYITVLQTHSVILCTSVSTGLKMYLAERNHTAIIGDKWE